MECKEFRRGGRRINKEGKKLAKEEGRDRKCARESIKNGTFRIDKRTRGCE